MNKDHRLFDMLKYPINIDSHYYLLKRTIITEKLSTKVTSYFTLTSTITSTTRGSSRLSLFFLFFSFCFKKMMLNYCTIKASTEYRTWFIWVNVIEINE